MNDGNPETHHRPRSSAPMPGGGGVVSAGADWSQTSGEDRSATLSPEMKGTRRFRSRSSMRRGSGASTPRRAVHGLIGGAYRGTASAHLRASRARWAEWFAAPRRGAARPQAALSCGAPSPTMAARCSCEAVPGEYPPKRNAPSPRNFHCDGGKAEKGWLSAR